VLLPLAFLFLHHTQRLHAPCQNTVLVIQRQHLALALLWKFQDSLPLRVGLNLMFLWLVTLLHVKAIFCQRWWPLVEWNFSVQLILSQLDWVQKLVIFVVGLLCPTWFVAIMLCLHWYAWFEVNNVLFALRLCSVWLLKSVTSDMVLLVRWNNCKVITRQFSEVGWIVSRCLLTSPIHNRLRGRYNTHRVLLGIDLVLRHELGSLGIGCGRNGLIFQL
jgi:hypothetical protein